MAKPPKMMDDFPRNKWGGQQLMKTLNAIKLRVSTNVNLPKSLVAPSKSPPVGETFSFALFKSSLPGYRVPTSFIKPHRGSILVEKCQKIFYVP